MREEGLDLFFVANRLDLGPSKPTEVRDCVWLYAICKDRAFVRGRRSVGKWLLFHADDSVDAAWAMVWRATRDGELGFASKVVSRFGRRGQQYVICVYTKDVDDVEDVRRVRTALRKMGYVTPIPYKTDEMTKMGVNGSKYFF